MSDNISFIFAIHFYGCFSNIKIYYNILSSDVWSMLNFDGKFVVKSNWIPDTRWYHFIAGEEMG